MKKLIINRFKQKFLLFAIIGFIVVGSVACNEGDSGLPNPPSWEPPQPIDNSLLGSWILANEYDTTIVTFYENNDCVIKYWSYYYNSEETRNWYIDGDTLILPGSYDSSIMRFPAYKYSLENEELLHIDFIIYPLVGKGPWTTKLFLGPLGNVPNCVYVYKKLEEE